MTLRRGTVLGSAVLVLLAGVVGWAASRREPEVVLARYASSLRGRTRNQIHNVRLAVRRIDGVWLAPGQTFSFNRTVRAWSSDSGFKRAPVSFNGELVPSWGGGVCQASSTLYNAALLAGLTVRERHRHRWLARYVPPGRDAAVAYPNIDLRVRNDHPWPVRLEAEVHGDLVEFRCAGREALPDRYDVRQRWEGAVVPASIRQPWRTGMPVRRVRNPGKHGCRVLTYRVRLHQGREVERQFLSDDDYPAMNRLVLD